MGFALKVGMVDFSSVAVDQVEYGDVKPCTSLTLDKSTLTFEKVNDTNTITATVVPSDTTDTLVWTSSNENVATVANGVVTIHGIGTVTITATCGSQTATASISQTTIKAPYTYTVENGYTASNITVNTDKKILGRSSLGTQSYAGQPYSNTDALRIKSSSNAVECISVPYGATNVNVDVNSLQPNYIEVVDTTSLILYDGLKYPEWVKNKGFPFANGGYAVEYGQAIALRGTTANIEDVNYVYFT